jgi:putative peptide zinc metalloprotease protein
MATLADSLVSSASRALNLRKRPDLATRRHMYQGHPYIVIKEPVGLKYFRFQEEEYAILEMLDGNTSLDQIKEEFERRFAPEKITLQDLQNFIGMLHRSGLVIAAVAGQGKQLRKRREETDRKKVLSTFSNVLALRWKGFDPEWILNKLYPFVRFLFHPLAVMVSLAIMLSALGLVLVQWDEFQSKLPAFHEFFGASNWWKMMIVLGVVKIIHEFGHGISCRHYGGECHEMGVMLLVLTPCLYCNVSDSWMLPNKWHRAIIGAAGMYVEVMIASICTWLWWFSAEGEFNFICLSIMFICSVSTVLFNGNPLLRFDGYYILSDILEVPNLRQKATEVLKRYASEFCLGMEQQEDPFLPKKNHFMFGLYTVAAVAYRWIIMISILMFLNEVLKPYGLQILGQFIALTAIVGMFIQPAKGIYKFFTIPGRMHQVKKGRLIATGTIAVAVIAGIAALPLPHYVWAVVEVVPYQAKQVFVDTPGHMEQQLVDEGSWVRQGQVLAELRSPDLQLAMADLQGQLEQYQSQFIAIQRGRYNRPEEAGTLAQISASIDMVEQQLAEKQQQKERLKITSPQSGFVFAPPSRPEEAREGQLRGWVGTPLSDRNLGAYLDESVLVCEVGNPSEFEAQLIIDQADFPFVAAAAHQREQAEGESDFNSVRIKLDALPDRTLRSAVSEIAEIDYQVASKSLSNQQGGQLATVTDPKTGAARPLSTSYQARALVNNESGVLRNGMRGQAKIFVGYEPLGLRLWRVLARTFHFQLT